MVIEICLKLKVMNQFFDFPAKLLHELILPVEKRIEDVRAFLTDIDHTLSYEIVPIQDPFGPTKSEPDLDVSDPVVIEKVQYL